jgi:hypothetical protein
MSDKPPPLAGALDPVRPRTIKAISDEVWGIITDAAHERRLTVGQFLEAHFKEWAAEGRPMTVEPSENRVGNPDKPSLAEVAQVLDAARELAKEAGVKVPAAMAREGLALARQATRAARGLPPLTPRPRALPSPSSE